MNRLKLRDRHIAVAASAAQCVARGRLLDLNRLSLMGILDRGASSI
jgi:hypothetical protein